MGKIIKITESELHNIIKNKIYETLEHNIDLEYSPAIGNKKRGPGEDIEDQMKKRKNKKLDEDSMFERDIMMKRGDGEMDYEGDDEMGTTSKTVTIELDENDYAVAFKNVLGREPQEEDFETLPIDVQVKINANHNVSKGDYMTPGTDDIEISNWSINDHGFDELPDDDKRIVEKAVECHIEACTPDELIA